MKELTLYLGNEPLGKVRVESIRGKEVFSFAYAEEHLKSDGWRLSPMLDVNPNPDAACAALDLTPGVQGGTRDELIESSEYFHVDRPNAEKRYAEILNVVSGWRSLAQKLNIRRTEIDRMSACFCSLNLA